MKKSLIALSVMMLSAISSQAYDFKSGDLAYNKIADTSTVEVTFLGDDYTSGKDYTGVSYTIPEEVADDAGNTYTVVRIGDSAFYESGVTKIILPSTVKEIAGHAFNGSSIESIEMPAVETIENFAFYRCNNLKELSLPATLKALDYRAFQQNSVEKLTLHFDPATFADAGSNGAFVKNTAWPSLYELIIGSDVNTLGADAIGYWAGYGYVLTFEASETPLVCQSGAITRWMFETLNVSRVLEQFDASLGKTVLMNVNMYNVAPFDVTFAEDTFTKAVLTVPEKYEADYRAAYPWNKFSSISVNDAANATYGFNYTLDEQAGTAEIIAAGDAVATYTGDIVIPESIIVDKKRYTVTSIGKNAFDSTNITSVFIPGNVKTIKESAFLRCPELTEVTLSEGIESLGMNAFNNCRKIDEITIPGSMKTVTAASFYNCDLKKIHFLEGVETIGSEAFEMNVNLEEISFPETVKEIGNSAFEGCTALANVKLPSSLRTLGWLAFSQTSVETFEIPEGFADLDMMAIGAMNGDWNTDKKIRKVVLPSTLKSIQAKSLNNVGALETLIVNGNGSEIKVKGTASTVIANVVTPDLKTLVLCNTFVNSAGENVTAEVFGPFTTLTDVTFGENLNVLPNLPNAKSISTLTVLNPNVPACPVFADEVYAKCKVIVPNGTASQFKAAEGWNKFVNLAELPAKTDIDASKMAAVYGEGDYFYALKVRFNNPERLDNLIFGYRSADASLTATDLLDAIAKADSRLNVTKNGEEITISADLDGDNAITENDVTASGNWTINTNLSTSDGNGVVVLMEFESESNSPEYSFYMPAADAVGTWIPEAMTVKMSDAGVVLPVLVQPAGARVNNYANWTYASSSETGTTSTAVLKSPNTRVGQTYNYKPTLVAPGTVYVQWRPYFNSYSNRKYSNWMMLTLEAPEVPITKLSVNETSIESGLNVSVPFEYSFEPENATYTAVNVISSDTSVATYNASSGLKTTKKAGNATISVVSGANPDVKAEFTLTSKLLNPVTDVNFGPGTEDGVINVPVRQLIGLKPVVTPENADIPEVTITLSGNGSGKADYTCSVYKVNWWDADNVRSQFYELSGHRPTGENPATVHVESEDGNFVKDFVVNVIEADRTPLAEGYEDGTIILNEEWFGHTNGGLNYITKNDEVIYQAYEKENPCMAFGATSQHGTIWGGKLIVASKQAQDGGDPLPGGGRLVIADAKTLKRLGSLDNLSFTVGEGENSEVKSGDGRAVCGATPDKIYVSASNGIYVVDITDPTAPVVTGAIGMTEGNDLYSGQVGDMINAGRYVFAVAQSGGLIVIDTVDDSISRISDPNIQGVTQTADGKVWYTTIADGCTVFVAIDPLTHEELNRVTFPKEIGTVACGWGAWRSTAFYGTPYSNDIWFVTGAAGFTGGASGDYYRWHLGEDPAEIKPFFSLADVKGVNGFGEEVGQMTYGTPRYDDRNNRLIVMAGRKGAASGGYRDHWIHFVDGTTGEITKTIKLNPYYWFQSLPIFPDKYETEIDIEEDKTLAMQSDPYVFDLTPTDKDSYDSNISLSLVETVKVPVAGNDDDVIAYAPAQSDEIAEITLEGNKLIIQPKAMGTTSFTLRAHSNGKVTDKTVSLTFSNQAGVGNISDNLGLRVQGRRLIVEGASGETLSIYNVDGMKLVSFGVDSDYFVTECGMDAGLYIVEIGGITRKVSLR